ncbi:hypothetical protein ILFOPFJJ_04838 [Ensifer psoraleae]|nr:hypothetical protein [Sinorhizobium psoraleae]
MLDLIVHNRRALRNDLFEQAAQLGDVPLPVAEFIDVLSDRLIAADLEGREEGTARALDAQVLVQDKQRIGYRVDYALRLHMAIAQQAIEVFQRHHHPAR